MLSQALACCLSTFFDPVRRRTRGLVAGAAVLALAAIAPTVQAQELDPEVAARPERHCSTIDPPAIGNRGTWESNLWPNGIIPFEFDANVSMANQNAMLAAMNELEAVCNVRFVVRNGEDPWVHIQDSTGNNSPVGWPGSDQNTINIFNWNSRFVMVHELMHTMGVRHEQSRTDRDTFNDGDGIFDESGMLTTRATDDGHLAVINLGIDV